MAYYFEVQAWRVKSGAGRYNDMRYALAFLFRKGEPIQSALRQLRSEALKQLHAPGRRGKVATLIELLCVAPYSTSGV